MLCIIVVATAAVTGKDGKFKLSVPVELTGRLELQLEVDQPQAQAEPQGLRPGLSWLVELACQ